MLKNGTNELNLYSYSVLWGKCRTQLTVWRKLMEGDRTKSDDQTHLPALNRESFLNSLESLLGYSWLVFRFARLAVDKHQSLWNTMSQSEVFFSRGLWPLLELFHKSDLSPWDGLAKIRQCSLYFKHLYFANKASFYYLRLIDNPLLDVYWLSYHNIYR